PARDLRRGCQEEGGREPHLQEDHRVPACIREARGAVGAGYGRLPQDGVRSLLRTKRQKANLACCTKQAEHHSGNHGMVLCHSQQKRQQKKSTSTASFTPAMASVPGLARPSPGFS